MPEDAVVRKGGVGRRCQTLFSPPWCSCSHLFTLSFQETERLLLGNQKLQLQTIYNRPFLS